MIVTFDIEGAEKEGGSLYESIGKDLAALGLHDELDPTLSGGGRPDKMPDNTYIGLLDGTSAAEVLERALGATVNTFRANGQRGSILAAVGGPDYLARTLHVRN